MTRLLIIRHAEVAYNVENRIQGHHDSGLTAKGLSQAKKLAKRIRKFKVDRIISSDLGRAMATALEISKLLRLPLKKDPLLREINLGEWEGMTPVEVDRLYNRGYEKWLKKPSSVTIPNSEGLRQFLRRITTRVKTIARSYQGQNVLIVTHGGAITALLTEWLKADFDNLLLNLHLENTGLTIVEETDRRVKIKFINDSSHLFQNEIKNKKRSK